MIEYILLIIAIIMSGGTFVIFLWYLSKHAGDHQDLRHTMVRMHYSKKTEKK